MRLTTTDDKELLIFTNPCSSTLPYHCKCCHFATIDVKTPDGSRVGRVQESCWMCKPTFYIYDGHGNSHFEVTQDQCNCCTCNHCHFCCCCSTEGSQHFTVEHIASHLPKEVRQRGRRGGMAHSTHLFRAVHPPPTLPPMS